MKRLLRMIQHLSELGLNEDTPLELRRPAILANRTNMVLAVVSLVYITTEWFTVTSSNEIKEFSLLVLALIFLVSFIHLFISSLGLTHLARIMLVLDFPVVVFLFPALTGHVGEQDFFWFPYIMVSMSIIPQLILHIRLERSLYILGCVYMFLLVIFSDEVLLNSISSRGAIVKSVEHYRFYYNRSVIVVWFFTNLIVLYLRLTAARTEAELLALKKQSNPPV